MAFVRRVLAVSVVALLASFGIVALAGAPVGASTITGSDLGGADLTVANGDVLSGTFTHVGTFTIPAGVTAHVAPGVALSISGTKIVIDGVLDGTGAGSVGGVASASPGVDGVVGTGAGAGGGGHFGSNVHGSGGGGAGYGGAGGDSSFSACCLPEFPAPAGAGGPTYGTAAGADLGQGSGGGSGANLGAGFPPVPGGNGGGGGASITLVGEIHLAGSILADGAAGVDGLVNPSYGTPGGGGGSGGGVLLSGTLYLDGKISALGGKGGNGTPGAYAQAGGGGGGGRIKLVGSAYKGPSFTTPVTGGAAGTRSGTGDGAEAVVGSDGTVSDTATPIGPYVPPAPPPPPVEILPTFTG